MREPPPVAAFLVLRAQGLRSSYVDSSSYPQGGIVARLGVKSEAFIRPSGLPSSSMSTLNQAPDCPRISDIGISRHGFVGFAAWTVDRPTGSGNVLNDRCWADREATLVKNHLVPACVDFPRSPCANAGNLRVLHVRINVEAIRAFARRAEPAAVNLVLKKMPLSAVVESDGPFV